jgi:phosphatidate cytidylyltransferase
VSERNLLLRVISAVVGLPLLGALVFWRQPLGFGVFSLVVVALGLYEYAGLTLREAPSRERLVLIVVGTAFAAAVYIWPARTLLWGMGAVVLLGTTTLLGGGDIKSGPARLAAAGFGLFYVGGLLTAFPLIHRDLPSGSLWVTVAFAVTFVNDTMAYFTGRAFGRHKLAPSISPGKTVEGGIGGLLGGMAFMLIARATFFPALTLIDVLAIGAGAGVLGPVGDLLESMLKRAAGAKDSGRLIPGHGGILDRIDSLLFVGALVYVFVSLAH